MNENLAITPNALTLSDWMGDIQVFGDLRQVSRNKAIKYYRLNSYQKRNFIWLLENHLPELMKYYEFNVDKCRSLVTVSRAGFMKTTQLIIVTLAVVDYSDTTALVLDTRYVTLLKKGGRRLLNPKRRGTSIHGKYVLKAPTEYSLLESKF